MAIELADNIQTGAPKPTDSRYLNNQVPYVDEIEVNSLISSGVRYTGLTVNIQGSEYWYKDGITDPDLIEKTSGGGEGTITGGTNGLSTSGANICLGGTLTEAVSISGAYPVTFSNLTTFNATSTATSKLYAGDLGPGGALGKSHIEPDIIELSITNSSSEKTGFVFNGTSFTVYDTSSSKGMSYAADYSSNITCLSIPNAGWVTGQTGGGGGSSLYWTGSTANALGTYMSTDGICAQPNLTFDGSVLDLTGTITMTSDLNIATGNIYLNDTSGTYSNEIRFLNDTVCAGIDFQNNGDWRFIDRDLNAVTSTLNSINGGFTTCGAIQATDHVEILDTGGAEGFKMEWNDTEKSIDFIIN